MTVEAPADVPSGGGAVAAPRGAATSSRPRRRHQVLLRGLAYAVLGLVLGIAYVILIAAGVLFAALAIVWAGLPLVLGVSTLAWRCARLERRLANRLLDARVAPLPPLAREPRAGIVHRVRARLAQGPLWRAVALLALRLPAAVLVVAVVAAGGLAAGALLVVGVEGVTGTNRGFVGPFTLGPPLGIVLSLLVVPVIVVTGALLSGLVGALRALARVLLAPRIAAGGPVRETLAESLGDRTLAIVYWLPDRGAFVNERGFPVPLPEPGSDRAWTAVDYEGRRVAAIIHDATLDAGPELVQAAAAAASLAIDNERLKAELRARVQELQGSRVRLVEASLAARQKLERDLHDGAQQQLVSLALDLKFLRGRVAADPEAAVMIDRIIDKLGDALAELRELARGIHPAILTDRGLEPALRALADRSSLHVRSEVEVPARLPPPVEAAAYFVCAEALTNVLKYAQATTVTLRASVGGGDVVVEVRDDGLGGADARLGSGLRGLQDRLGALDGVLTLDSPPGQGTLVRARIPCAGAEPAADGHPEALDGSGPAAS